ncbi:hypothetical protein GCM10009838_25780 [Catenulispora subtropica]|uniref:TnsA endonuclease N-terminal domain-containing protein n=1 Tax=Catenulispora subtropica TaxID=450798 RepID=A0ABN2RD61_9ACTN
MARDEVLIRSVQVRFIYPDGSELRCPLADAPDLPFESFLPCRKISHHKSQRNAPAWYWSSTINQMIEYESFLERVWMTLLDFDPDVSAFSAQPMQLIGADTQGTWKATPDLFVRRSDGSATVMEVKNPRHLADPEVQLTAARVAACCRAAGWGYELVGEPPDRQRTTNILMLMSGYRREMTGAAQYRDLILAAAADPTPIGTLAEAVEEPLVGRAVVLHLCSLGDLVLDLSAPLEDSTLVRSA